MAMTFKFGTTPNTQSYCEAIVDCMVRYGGKSPAEALDVVNQFVGEMEHFDEENSLLHECPNYWAMCLIHSPKWGDNQPDWWKNPALWPPPRDHTWWYGNTLDQDGGAMPPGLITDRGAAP